MNQEEKPVLVCIPPLVALLKSKESQKGSPLTEEEVITIRDNAVAMAVTEDTAKTMEESRGYPDIDPENCWEEWQVVRKELQ